MVSRRISLSLLILFCLCGLSNAYGYDPIASIDRSEVSIDDTFILTIRIEGSSFFSSPDTSPLQKDFQVLSTSQSSSHTFVNGSSQSTTEWNIALAPKREGLLHIPPLTIGSQQTQGLTVTVKKRVANSAYDTSQPVFIESEISADNVYVQQQLLFTVRVFQGIELDNMNLSEIELEDAVVEKLGQDSFERRINNQRYRVHELRYAIFPQHSGTLTIPEVVFSANELTSRRGFFNLPGQGRPLRKITKQYDITVMKPDASFAPQAKNSWLPAKDVQLQESWSSDLEQIKVGDSITRTITTTAQGLTAAQLPPINFSAPEGARYYPDQGQTENSLTQQGVTGVRTDSVAIIPTQPGKLQLPPVVISWWDTEENRFKQSKIAGRTLEVKAAPATAITAANSIAADERKSQPPTATHPIEAGSQPARLWQLLTLLFACLWLLTTFLWWKNQKRQPADQAKYETTHSHPASEKQRFSELLEVCQLCDMTSIRSALIAWGQCQWPQQNIHSMSDLQRNCDDAELLRLLRQLDRQLYGASTQDQAVDGQQLAAKLKPKLKQWREQAASKPNHKTAAELPPLYRR